MVRGIKVGRVPLLRTKPDFKENLSPARPVKLLLPIPEEEGAEEEKRMEVILMENLEVEADTQKAGKHLKNL